MKRLFWLAIFSYSLALSLPADAQKKYNYNWFFGNTVAMKFEGNPLAPVPVNGSVMTTYATISISDNETGELLFYTNGERIWNKNHQLMPNGTKLQPFTIMYNILEVPKPDNLNQYYIFSINFKNELWYSVVDMSSDEGLGDITNEKSVLVSINASAAITAVKKQDGSGYWLITKEDTPSGPTNTFIVYNITKDGINPIPTTINIGEPCEFLSNLKSNSKGTTLALTEGTTTSKVQLFNFDKQNGTLNTPITLHKEIDWDHAFGAAFSSDDTKLYISYSGVNSKKDSSHIVQYSGTNFSNWSIVASVDSNNSFNDLQLGPDGKLYIDNKTTKIQPATTWSTTLDVIVNPDSPASSIIYVKDFIDFGITKRINVRLPNFINDKSKNCNLPNILQINSSNTCINNITQYTFTGHTVMPDSVLWKLSDSNGNDTLVKTTSATHQYKQQGKYKIAVDFYLCGNKKTFTDTVTIGEYKISLGADTAFCQNDSIDLLPDKIGSKYLWSTGDTIKSIKVNKIGVYWLKITTPECSATDSIFVTELPPILIELGNGFTVCEHDTINLVRLNAGKGFSAYKWTPTGDTTQWIIVKQAGDYYVVVEDYRGCKGDDGANVTRLCGFDFYLPNAFTPNGDGINDVFMPTALDILDFEVEIYNTWGERVFRSNNPQQGWDGTYKGKDCPQGIYLYKISFKGYSNKLLKVFNYKGNVSLVR